MKMKCLFIIAGLIMFSWAYASGALAHENGPEAEEIQIAVDPRVELMSIIFRLAGAHSYSQGKLAAYNADVDQYFLIHRDHLAIKIAKKLLDEQGVSFDAVISMAAHVTDAYNLAERVPFDPYPKTFDERWTLKGAREFLAAARGFVRDTDFKRFIESHGSLYRVAEERLSSLVNQNLHFEWFSDYFGVQKGNFRLVPGMLTAGSSYAVQCTGQGGENEIWSVTSISTIDSMGMPEFSPRAIPTIIHEFTHSYSNPIIAENISELSEAGENCYPVVKKQMEAGAYGVWQAMFYEYLVRACVIRYVAAFDGPDAGRRLMLREEGRGFYLISDLCNLLEEYEKARNNISRIENIAPRIIGLFKEWGMNNGEKLKRKKAELQNYWVREGPKVVSIAPPNGSLDVDPSLEAIHVVFDRPMADRSWSVCTIGDKSDLPISGSISYDSTRMRLTIPVNLEPGKEYAFGLNSEVYMAFQCEKGIPMAPVEVRFKTRGKAPEPK